MREQYRTIELKRTDDYDYLRACGLIVKRKSQNSKQVQVVKDHYRMAENFLDSRRKAELMRELRRSAERRAELRNNGV